MDGGRGWVVDGNRKDSRATAPSKDKPVPCGYLLSAEFFSFFFQLDPTKAWIGLRAPNACIHVYIIMHVHNGIKAKEPVVRSGLVLS